MGPLIALLALLALDPPLGTGPAAPGCYALTRWEWTFENGSPPTSSLRTPPPVVFPAGDHAVTLRVGCAETMGPPTTRIVTVKAPPEVIFADGFESGDLAGWER